MTRLARAVAAALAAAALGSTPACRREAPREYEMTGQVLSVQRERQEVTIRHDDIAGLMPGMTMSFAVEDPALLEGREPGELIRATLVVTDALGRLRTLERTGFRALPDNSNIDAIAGSLLKEGDPMPDAALIDQDDRRRSLSEWRGRVALVTFIYTQCPLANYCPLMDRNFARLQAAIAGDPALRERVRLISVSFDPEHDTPAALAAHARRLGADPAVWTFLTGDRATVDRLGAAMGVGLIREADGTITHNLRTILVSADHRIARVYAGNEWSPDTVLQDLRRH